MIGSKLFYVFWLGLILKQENKCEKKMFEIVRRAITLGLGTWSDSEISSIMLTSPTGYTTGFVRFF